MSIMNDCQSSRVVKRVIVCLTSYLWLHSCTRFLTLCFWREDVRAQHSVLLFWNIFVQDHCFLFIVMGYLLLLSFYCAIFPRHLKASYHIFWCVSCLAKMKLYKNMHRFFFHLSEELLMKCSEMLLNLQVPCS